MKDFIGALDDTIYQKTDSLLDLKSSLLVALLLSAVYTSVFDRNNRYLPGPIFALWWVYTTLLM